MKIKVILCFVLCMLCAATTIARDRDKRATIKDYLNQEILIADVFAGQSITLVRENNEYFILRKYFGSGTPVIDSTKYKAAFNSDYQIEFGKETIKSLNIGSTGISEVFRLGVEEKGLSLYLNGLKVVISERASP